MNDKSNQLRVVSFENTLVQIEILDIDKWREENTGKSIKLGSIIKIEDGEERSILVLVKSFRMKEMALKEDEATEQGEYNGSFIINAQPIGQLEKKGDSYYFIKGIKDISIPPNGVSLANDEEIKSIFAVEENKKLIFAEHLINPDIEIEINGDDFFSKHIAVVGSTGSGKSCAVAKIIQEAEKTIENQEKNNTHIIIFDIHGEYKKAFPNCNYLSIEKNTLKLPYWLMNSEELEDMFIESNEQNSHNQVSQFKYAVTENKKKYNPTIRVTYDSPVYFSIEEVTNYICNKNNETLKSDGLPATISGEEDLFENVEKFEPTKTKVISRGSFYGEFNRFLSRLETKLNDERLNFILHAAKEDENRYLTADFQAIVETILGYKKDKESNITVIDLSSLPFEVVSLVVSIVSRLVFDFSYYSTRIAEDGKINETPFMLVYEEAHKYIPKNTEVRYKNTRLAVERIAKEGRKYGISSMIVSQRPSEISSTVFSQCNNFVVMRLTNPDDQSYIRKLLPEAVVSYGDALASLEKREALIVGEAIATPVIGKILETNPTPKSDDVNVYQEWKEDWKLIAFDEIIKQINKDK